MKPFIIYIIGTLFIYIILLESTTRIFDLSGHTITETNLNNNRLGLPNSEGIWVKGGLREIASHYKINQQGFNSLKDYSALDKNTINIAIIGDSYVEGFHEDVENSIGRILEKETKDTVEVHEYAKSGGNIVDFSLMFNQWIKNRYDYTFILISNRDITAKEAFFMGKGHTIPEKSTARDIYNRLSFIRYLNINHGLGIKLKQTFACSTTPEVPYIIKKNDVNSSAFKAFDSTCVILYEKEKLDTTLIAAFNIPFTEIVHQFIPINNGFDLHWNYNGRKNCALTIKQYLKKVSPFNKAQEDNITDGSSLK